MGVDELHLAHGQWLLGFLPEVELVTMSELYSRALSPFGRTSGVSRTWIESAEDALGGTANRKGDWS